MMARGIADPGDLEVRMAAVPGWEIEPLARTWTGRQVLCASRNRTDTRPPILITAGSHPTEHAGVVAAVELLGHISWPGPVYVVPARDTVAVMSYAATIEAASGEQVVVTDFAEASATLRRLGDVIWDEGGLLIAVIGEVAFAAGRPNADELTGSSDRGLGYQRQLVELAQTGLLHRDSPLAGRRLVLPYGYYLSWSWPYERAHSVLVAPSDDAGGYVPIDVNGAFHRPHQMAEVDALRALCDDVRPALTMDLHDGYGSSFYLFTSLDPVRDEAAAAITEAILSAVRARDVVLPDEAQLKRLTAWKERFSIEGDGLMRTIYKSRNRTLVGYDEAYGPGFQLHSGLGASLDDQVAMLVSGTLAGIDAAATAWLEAGR